MTGYATVSSPVPFYLKTQRPNIPNISCKEVPLRIVTVKAFDISIHLYQRGINFRYLQCWLFSFLMTLVKQHRMTWESDHEKQVDKEGRDDGIVQGPTPTLVWTDGVKSREIVRGFL
jgi:hypothetical protein